MDFKQHLRILLLLLIQQDSIPLILRRMRILQHQRDMVPMTLIIQGQLVTIQPGLIPHLLHNIHTTHMPKELLSIIMEITLISHLHMLVGMEWVHHLRDSMIHMPIPPGNQQHTIHLQDSIFPILLQLLLHLQQEGHTHTLPLLLLNQASSSPHHHRDYMDSLRLHTTPLILAMGGHSADNIINN